MNRAASPIVITAELEAFLESGLSVVIGTRDVALAPEIARAWGPRVARGRKSASVCIAMAAGARTLRNLRDNGRLAVSFALPTNYKAIQLWGRCIATGQPTRRDLSAIDAHRESFARLNEGIGVPRRFSEALWQQELKDSPAMIRIRFVAERAFDQTPGPDAGVPL